MRVLALTFGNAAQASSFYRIFQFIAPLREAGIELTAVPADSFSEWSRLAEYDAVIVQKKLFSLGKVRLLRRRAKALVYDVDDAIWHPHGRRHSWFTTLRSALRLRAIVRAAHLTLAANEVLAAHLRPHATRLTVLPMALDESAWMPRAASAAHNPVIGWSGHPVNLPYLEAIEPALLALRAEFPNARLAVFSGQPPRFREMPFDLIPFQAGAEPAALRTFDIGLLPLPEGAFAEGKSPIKGLQYMACGIPTVLPPRGAAHAMFRAGESALFATTPAEWTAALGNLLRDPALRHRMGAEARRDFEAHHTVSTAAARLKDLLKSLAAN